MSAEKSLRVFFDDGSSLEIEGGLSTSRTKEILKNSIEVSVEVLSENLKHLVSSFANIGDAIPEESNLRPKEIKFTALVDVNGEVALVVSKGGIGSHMGIDIVLEFTNRKND